MPDSLLLRRDVEFLLYDWLGSDRSLDRSTIDAFLDLSEQLAEDHFLTHYKRSDVEEPSLDKNGVRVCPAIGAALARYADLGLFSAGFPEHLGGLDLPFLLCSASFAYFAAANIATAAYPMLTVANARLIATFGTPAQTEAFAKPAIAGRWFGTMCLSEPQAGSSLADISTRAVADGHDSLGDRYRLTGSKMWISGGDQDISENIVHLVLAKIPAADGRLPQGTAGISLFIVPKWLPDKTRNDIFVSGLNHKMGYRGTSNCVLNLGDGAGATGWLIGAAGQGLIQMFHMMNEARIGVGLANTQEMMCANLAMGQMARTRRPDDPRAVMLDWLPWNHTMGGNATFQGNLSEGGTTYIDDGKPLPGLFEETLRNLREISPTYFANVPAGYAMLATALENDDSLAARFFKNLNSLAYGGATLPSDLYERMETLAVKHTGFRLPFVTGWGSTETAPTATTVHWASERVGLIGLPFPGVQLKLVPTGEEGRYELRLKSVIVTPGYFRRPDLTAEMFDEEGFYKIGDAGRFVDPDDPSWGLIFDGRVVEDFKLTSGTFVLVGTLRSTAIAAASPVLQDAVICGQDREYAGLLGFPNIAACRQLVGDEGARLTTAELLAHPAVVGTLRDGLGRMNKEGKGSSMRVRRALLMAEPPSVDGHEITDKGYINQRATLERRKLLVERLYDGGDGVIEVA